MAVCQLAPGDWITNGVGISSKGISWLRAKLSDIKECDAPESKRTEAGIEFTRRVPITILVSCRASSMLTWLTLTSWLAGGLASAFLEECFLRLFLWPLVGRDVFCD